ncbi:hypothetical protein [Rhizobium ruizarguesonis]|uniref:hypothetical protein n=1 Tax=Rhizobium ruizarguesonis TaxID=2081791 RepID=UPI0013EE8759|nr:hypothetical protein [Rhizobium ruizarguesonis]
MTILDFTGLRFEEVAAFRAAIEAEDDLRWRFGERSLKRVAAFLIQDSVEDGFVIQ